MNGSDSEDTALPPSARFAMFELLGEAPPVIDNQP
jgi:hypothetical protein